MSKKATKSKIEGKKFESLVELGFTKEAIARTFGATVSTVNRFCAKNYDCTFVEYKTKFKRSKTGRPEALKDISLEELRKVASLGLTNDEIADWFGVCRNTLTAHAEKDELFLNAIKLGKLKADANVVRSLYSRAIGYSHKDVHVSTFQGAVTMTDIVKHYAPEVEACKFWLKNRRSEDWQDKKEIEMTEPSIFDIFDEFGDEDENEI